MILGRCPKPRRYALAIHRPSRTRSATACRRLSLIFKVISGDGISDAHKRVGSCLQRMSPPAASWAGGARRRQVLALARTQDVVGGTKRAAGERSSAAGKLRAKGRPANFFATVDRRALIGMPQDDSGGHYTHLVSTFFRNKGEYWTQDVRNLLENHLVAST